MGVTVGIDLGTTNSVVAWIDSHGRPVVIPNAVGQSITPSVICFQEHKILVGNAAKEQQALGTWPIAAFFKRQMGEKFFLFNANDAYYTAVDLSAIILRQLKADAEARISKPITHAVITVPAYFKEQERQATIAAGVAAGLEVIQVINEPTAAAIAYGFAHREAGRRLLVYDLGGGTFDVTLLELTQDGVKVRTSDGDHQLGGKDWDDRIVEFLAEKFKSQFGMDPLEHVDSVADLLIQAETAKKQLSALDAVELAIDHAGKRGRYRINRATFESITADLLTRTVTLTLHVLSEMGLQPKDINGVLLVGGSTRMPMVRRFVTDTLKIPLIGGVNVDEAVAIGAAIAAAEQTKDTPIFALRGPIKTVDVTNHSLGMIAVNADNSAYINSLILPKNKEIPCTETRPYQYRTSSRGDNHIEVFMTQGETAHPAEISYIGKYVIHDIPAQHSGITVVNVTYHYDLSGTVKVTAQTKSSPQDLRITIENLPADIPDRFLVPPAPLKLEVPQHLTAYLAFDLSGSMSGTPLAEAQKAAHGFLQNTDLTHCSLGIIAFSDTVGTKLQASQDAREISKAIDKLRVCETGCGNATHPFDEISSLLKNTEGRKFAITLADGMWSNQQRAIERAKACHAAAIDVIAIGFGSADRDFLRSIASSDEASFFTPLSGLVETFTTIAQVLTETGGNTPVAGSRLGFLAGVSKV